MAPYHTCSLFALTGTLASHSLEKNRMGEEGAAALANVLSQTQIKDLKCAAEVDPA